MKKRALLGVRLGGLASLVLAGLLFHRHHAAVSSRGPHEALVGDVVEGVDDDGELVSFRIESIDPDPRDREGETHLYGLSVKSGGAWVPYCVPDADGRRAAIPLNGSYDVAVAGMLVDHGPDALTFACTSGAIGKCVRWGYKPWQKADAAGAIAMSDLHAACVRMVRADYCGDGRAHTKNGTKIDVYDRRGVQTPDPDPEHREELEAGWSPSGATYLNVPRWTDDVASIVAECPTHFAHRTSLDERLTTAQIAMRFPETVLFDNRMKNPADRF